MKNYWILFSFVLIVFLSSCVTNQPPTTPWGPEYVPDTPWRVGSLYKEIEELPVFYKSETGNNIEKGSVKLLIYPSLNAYSLYFQQTLLEWQIFIFEKDFNKINAILDKYIEWRKQAINMNVPINKEIDRYNIPLSLKYNNRKDYINALPNASFILYSTTSSESKYFLHIQFDKIDFFDHQSGYNPTLSNFYFMLDNDTSKKIKHLISSEGTKQSLTKFDKIISKEEDLKEKENEELIKEKEIYDSFK